MEENKVIALEAEVGNQDGRLNHREQFVERPGFPGVATGIADELEDRLRDHLWYANGPDGSQPSPSTTFVIGSKTGRDGAASPENGGT